VIEKCTKTFDQGGFKLFPKSSNQIFRAPDDLYMVKGGLEACAVNRPTFAPLPNSVSAASHFLPLVEVKSVDGFLLSN
jgi:hypothetical protein